MRKEYQNFADIWADYPETYGFRIGYEHQYDTSDGRGIVMASSLQAYICTTKATFRSEASKYWKKLTIKQDDVWFTSIESYACLRGLRINLNHTTPSVQQFYAQAQASFSALTRLEHLVVTWCNTGDNSVFYIPDLPALRSLYVLYCPYLRLEAILSLEECTILHAKQIDIADILSKLNPETLQTLAVIGIKDLSFSTAFLSTKITFPYVKSLQLSFNKLQQVPDFFDCFQNLHHVSLEYNPLNSLPASLLRLSELKELNLTKTPYKDKNIIKDETTIIKFIQQDIALDIKQKLWDILSENKKAIQKTTFFELLYLLTATKQKEVLEKINALCEKKFKKNPLDNLPPFTHLALVGKLPAMSFADAKNSLASHNIVVTSRITAATQVVCIGEDANPTHIIPLLAMPQKPVICLPTHLKAYIYALETPYLVDTTENIIHNLTNLLASNDKTNILLALQMIKTGGLPAMFFEYLCLLWIENTGDCRKEIKEVLKKYSTATQFLGVHFKISRSIIILII